MPFHLMPSLSNSVGIARRLDEFAKFLLTLHVDNNYCELTNYDDTNVSVLPIVVYAPFTLASRQDWDFATWYGSSNF